MKNTKIFQIERVPNKEDDKSVYGFEKLLDKMSIEEALKQSNESMPNFCLSKVEIHPSGFCNSNCDYCYGGKLAPKKRKNLSKEAIEKILKDLRQNMPAENPLIILSGLYSDPLMNPEIKRIIQTIGKYRFRFGLYTNGLLLDEELISLILDAALRARSIKPSFISFNISASINLKKFDKLLEKIKLLSGKRKNKEKFQINAPIIVDKQMINDSLFFILKKLDCAGVDNIRFSFQWVKHDLNIKQKYVYIPENEYNREVEFLNKLKAYSKKVLIRLPQKQKEFSRCFSMAHSLSISPEGDVYPCPEVSSPFFKDKLSYGNIKENSLSEIWKSPKHYNLFKRINPIKIGCLCCPVSGDFNFFCNNLQNQIKENI